MNGQLRQCSGMSPERYSVCVLRHWLLRLGIAAVLVAYFGPVAASSGALARSSYDACPRPATVKSSAGVDAAAVITATYKAIRRLFPHINYGQGRKIPVTRRTTQFTEVIALSRTSSDAVAFRRLASRRCGKTTAAQSWAVVADFPEAPDALYAQRAFLVVLTRDGWKLYGSAIDHH